MRVFKLEMLGSSCTFERLEELLSEVKIALEEGYDNEVVIRPIEMAEEEYRAMPEFQGW